MLIIISKKIPVFLSYYIIVLLCLSWGSGDSLTSLKDLRKKSISDYISLFYKFGYDLLYFHRILIPGFLMRRKSFSEFNVCQKSHLSFFHFTPKQDVLQNICIIRFCVDAPYEEKAAVDHTTISREFHSLLLDQVYAMKHDIVQKQEINVNGGF